MKERDIEQLLGEHPFFETLAPEYRALIAGCGQVAAYAPGEFLFRAGADAEHFFLLRKGKVALEITAPGQQAFVFETVTDGAVVGWSWLIEPHVTQFDARAIESTRVIRFDGKCLRGKCDADPRLGYDLLRRFARVIVQRYADTRLQLLDVYGKTR